ncbi:MazG-like protein [Chryseobacterium sp. C39-AII1]|uniref:MazG-like protein n=1 Tax=Chryseobacterium sp. C39-AII1 TaxID=3080332 RepID=UPI003208F678
MNIEKIDDLIDQSLKIREKYHQLERIHHGSEWTVEEDALAYLTDAGLIGRNIMSEQKRWPKQGAQQELEHKLGENIWWLVILAERSGINIKDAVNNFMKKTNSILE